MASFGNITVNATSTSDDTPDNVCTAEFGGKVPTPSAPVVSTPSPIPSGSTPAPTSPVPAPPKGSALKLSAAVPMFVAGVVGVIVL